VRTRRARPEDLAEAGEVTVAAYAEHTAGDQDGYSDLLRDAARRDREAEVWVATPDDSEEILGTVTICPEGSEWREVAQPGEGEFRALAVKPGARGQGVGATLLGLVVERFRAEDASRIVMSTQAGMHAAQHLYEAAGFVRAPERDWSPAAGVDLLGYRLELGS
jgi:ribosomal protein S18 acetylase RimI-like enzyme